MKINYTSNRLEKILSNRRQIQKHYTKIYTKLVTRLSELQVANNLAEISSAPPPRRHKLSENFDGCWGIDVSKNYRLIIRPSGNYNIDDLTTITEITIEDISDYH